VDTDAPTITDMATLTVESDGMEGVMATAPVNTSIFNAAAGGPDAFGNTWVSSAGGDQEYFFVTLEDATVVTLADNGVAGPFPLGGVLNWYGTPVNEFFIGANGVIGFNATNLTTTINTTLPTTGTPNGLIALFWDNMNPAASGTVSYGLDESDRLVVTFDDVAQVPAAAGNLTAQIVIDFSAGHIFCNYAQVEGLVLNSCTIGIEDATGTDGLTVLFNGAPGLPLGEWTVRFNVPPPPDYWPSLQDGVTIMGAADSQVTASMAVTNLGLLQDSFAITATADNGVEVDVLINGQPGVLTPVVQPNDSYTFELELSIPEVPGSPTGTVTVTATSQGDTGLADQATAALTIVLVQGGPDAGGYFWSTSDADGAVEYEWVTIENPTVVTGLTDDSVVGPFEIGFPWTHYGNEYTQVHIASNGSIGFNPTGMGGLGNTTYPTAATPNDMISFFWDDLNPVTAGGVVSYGTQDGMFIVEFNQVFEFGGTGPHGPGDPGYQRGGRAHQLPDPDFRARHPELHHRPGERRRLDGFHRVFQRHRLVAPRCRLDLVRCQRHRPQRPLCRAAHPG
jgi:hypothetical protein